MSLRSNIPEISKHTFRPIDADFAERALQKGGGSSLAEKTTVKAPAGNMRRWRPSILE
jgi:hypothetical protein